MENYDRFVEIQNAAMDSEDAGVLQYAKTLDSLESKLNQISNSFQQFYMSIINGPAIGSLLTVINNLITNLSSLPKILSITKVISFIGQIKTVIQMVFNMISSGFSKISLSSRQWRDSIAGDSTSWAERLGQNIANAIANGIEKNKGQVAGAIEGATTQTGGSRMARRRERENSKLTTGRGLYAVGAAMTAGGLMVSQDTDGGYLGSTALSALGGGLTAFAMGMTGNPIGAAIQGLTTIFELVSRIVNASEARIERLSKQLEKDNVQRAEDKNNAKTLAEYIDKEQELRAARYDSAEAMQEYLDVSNEIAEKYPQFTSYINESGNAIVNMSSATEYLKQALDAAAKSSKEWGKTAIKLAEENYKEATNEIGVKKMQGGFGVIANQDYANEIRNSKASLPVNIRSALASLYENGTETLIPFSGDDPVSRLHQLFSLTGASDLQELVSTLNALKSAKNEDDMGKTGVSSDLQELIEDFLGEGIFEDSLDGIFTISENYGKQLKAYQELTNAKQSALSSNIYAAGQQYLFANPNYKQWAQDNNVSAYITSMASQAALNSEDTIAYVQDFDSEAYKGLFERLQKVFTTLDQDMLEAFNEKPESISAEQLDTFVGDIGEDDKEVKDAIIARWVDSNSAAFVALATAMDKDVLSYSDYLAEGNLVDSQASKVAYYETLQVVQSELVKQLDATTAQTAADYLQDFQKIANDTSLPESQRKAAENMGSFIQQALIAINDKVADAVTKDNLVNALFSDDIGSYGWAQNVENLFSEAGINLDNSVQNAVYMGLDAMLDDVVNQATSAMSLLEEMSSKQSSGMSYEDASNYARKLKMEGSIFDNFNVKDGKYYFNDYDAAQTEYVKQQKATLEQERDAIKRARMVKPVLSSSDDGRTFDEDVLGTIDSLEDGGIKEAALQWYDSASEAERTVKGLRNWLAGQGQEAEDAIKAFEELDSRLTKDRNISDLKKAIDGAKINLTADVFNIDWWEQFGDTKWIEESFTTDDIKQHLEGTGYVFDTITGQVSRTIEAIKQDLENTSDEEQKAYYRAELESKKEELVNAVGNYTGLITQEQINELQQQGVDVSVLKAGERWTRDLVVALFPDIADQAGGNWDSTIEEQSSSIKSSMEKVLTSMAKGEDVLVNDVVEVWESITNKQAGAADRAAIEKAMEQGWQGVAALLQSAVNQSNIAPDFANQLKDILDSVIDAIRSTVESVVSGIKSGASGSLSRADVTEMSKQTGIGEAQLLNGATQTLSGYQLGQDALLRMAGATSSNYGYRNSIAQTLIDEGIVKSYEEVGKLIELANDGTKEWGDQTEVVVSLLKEVQSVMENSVSNDSWFNPDYYGNLDDKFQDYLDKASKGASLLQSIFNGEQISRSDSEFLVQVASQSQIFQDIMGTNTEFVNEFYQALADHTDITTGEIDFAGALDQIGMSFESFGDSFAESVSNFADERIKQLEAMKSMLESQQEFANALQKASEQPIDLFAGIQEGTDATQAIQEQLDALDATVDTAVQDYKLGNSYEEVFGQKSSEGFLQAIHMTPEQLAALPESERANINEMAKYYYQVCGEALTNPDNWTSNDSSAYIENVLGQIQTQMDAKAKEMGFRLPNSITDSAEQSVEDLQKQIDTLVNELHKVTITADISAALVALQQLKAALSTISTTVSVDTSARSVSPGGSRNSFERIHKSNALGNVALYQGTQLAGKTLVGELGPEMAVYDNAYHILGQNGAEFVSLPDNAIVFNHKQTEGILNGQAGHRGKTKNGGPAFAGGNLSAAIAAIDKEIALWKSMKDLTLTDMLGGGGGGGGGSGNTIKAHIEDLVEWYNLTRQIADIEQKINNIVAERENITDGHEYLRNLREQQHLLEGQAIVQRTLLNYQQKQVELQAKQINTNSIWSKFFTVGEDGLLQYIMGNEENGGKGTLSMLQQLNQMSGEQQLSYIKGLGYSYTDNDGNVLDGEDLVAKFYEEAQEQIDKYDELRDTVEETDETLSKLQSSINEIEEEIRQNQLKLEQAIYDSIVSAWEKQISQLTEQMNLLKEANDAYVNGLSDALNKEKNLYSQNQSTSEREQLQRQLSLLRRAGGSASQIASLEEQLDSSLKNEYFNHQQESIDSIKEANEKQIDALNKQIQIQQETLDFQKENGVLWTKVYEILSRSDSEILEFLAGSNGDFFTKSAEGQKEMLLEWAKEVGIYKENNDVGYIGNRNAAADNFATQAWNSTKGAEKKKQFEAVSKDSQELLKDYFASAYANAKLNGMNDEEAYNTAREDMYKKLYSTYTEQIGAIGGSTGTTDGQTGGSGGGSSGSGSGSGNSGKNGKTYSTVSITVSAGKGGGSPTLASSGGATSAKVAAGSRVVIAPNPLPGYAFDYITYNGTKKSSMSIITTGKVASIDIKVYYKSNGIERSGGQGGKDAVRSAVSAATGTLVDQNNQPALLHKGEGVFTAKQTSALIKMVDNFQQLATGNVGASLLASLLSTTKNYSNLKNDSQQVSAVNVNPGAVVIQVEQLNDRYDIDSVATDVFNKITSIASKATSRGVNRR